MKKIVLAGGSGNIGKKLSVFLENKGYEVLILSRRNGGSNTCYWDGKELGEWVTKLEGVYGIINLSGKSIQTRFTSKNKKELLDSRIEPTLALGRAIATLKEPPRIWINFSGISIFEGIETYNDENSKEIGSGFLSELSQIWEQTFWAQKTPETVKVCLRISPVLSNDFGVLKELVFLTRFGLGGKVGNGDQKMAWIHEEDLFRMTLWILENQVLNYTYHACVKEPISNKFFMKTLRKVIGANFGLTLPRRLAQIGAFVKGIDSSLLLNTNNVGTTETLNNGFEFKYSNLENAFRTLIK